ncbi:MULTISPECIES: putative manganese-dependent inorganic diphosphatase [Treponema]|uniref:inorganic diphosphatase n=1 Tax=Treponema rectale TaxID=744512 RepID=A0A840SHI4_9SPIR|nr:MULTISPECIES: putative manganese-dependent inorganic diphosphatase [Treponema]MBB5219366.1 manganese-dependent inorganic pyrophosphatase [Treponema rectale]MBE6354293.1 putative manganese-dependent inorganic diphosphatase [Treponema sp.]MBO6176163.1 putative manganese-dependent inorganic diphosphatase [Treponema sp.]QOS40750.1 putative manganese-dependent inorganic diphosphatase [Treponema rectale]
MKNKVYVIGHKNPDTDSVVAAVAYAKLRNLLGHDEYIACRAGHLNPQTSYIFQKFNIQRPQYIPNLIPKVEYYMPEEFETVNENVSVWEAIGRMEKTGLRVLPVVDGEGKYLSLLHYSGFAQSVLRIMNPEKRNKISTSISLIQKTLNAQPIILNHDADKTFKAFILVGSSSEKTFIERLESHSSEDLVVIVSDREDIQKLCIEHKVKLMILTSGFALNKELRELAEKNGVSVIISPYTTTPTAMLIAYSTPVAAVADKEILPVHINDTTAKIQDILKHSQCKYLPVVDENNKVIGIISEHDLLKEPNISVVMVDHNELSQAVEDIDHYKILGVIDHHRLGTLSTKYPITFINKPVGSTATLITQLYREYRVPIPKEIAALLLCGILSDTLVLQSATVTDLDVETADYLSDITNLDVKELGNEILLAGSHVSGRAADEIIRQDMKEYTEGKAVYTVSQIEVGNPKEILDRKEDFLAELEIERRSHKGLFSCLLVTDITTLSSVLLIESDKNFLPFITFPKQEENVYYLQGVVSRKKQLVPLITEQVLNYLK